MYEERPKVNRGTREQNIKILENNLETNPLLIKIIELLRSGRDDKVVKILVDEPERYGVTAHVRSIIHDAINGDR